MSCLNRCLWLVNLSSALLGLRLAKPLWDTLRTKSKEFESHTTATIASLDHPLRGFDERLNQK